MLTTILMFAAGAGAVFGLVKMRQGEDWAKGVVVVCAILAIFLAVQNTRNRMGGNKVSKREKAQIRKREAAYQKTGGEKLGQVLAQKFPGAKAVVIRPIYVSDIFPDSSDSGRQDVEQQLTGLKAGLGDSIDLLAVKHPTISKAMIDQAKSANIGEQPGDDTIEYQAYMIDGLNASLSDTDAFNEAMQGVIPAEATMVVMLTDFPYQLRKVKLLAKKLTVAGVLTQLNEDMDKAIQAGYIAAIVITKPKGDYISKDLPKHLDERFSRRFLLITPDNVKAVAEENKNLFPHSE